jgi:hypothetical protein
MHALHRGMNGDTQKGENSMTRLTGFEAIEMKRKNEEVELNKYNDPTEEERFDLSIKDAEEIAAEDPNLIYSDMETANSK